MERVETLEEAKKARKVSGDIVIDDNDQVVTDRAWLFPWETTLGRARKKWWAENPRSYALRQILWQEENPQWSFLWHKKEIS
jgi:hypothetical protein